MSRRDPWASFWSASGQRGAGCLPHGDAGTAGRLERIWQDFAGQLPAKAKILDLATGDGVVLRNLKQGGGRLQLVGVDSAPRLPSLAGATIHAGVRMEAMPFPDRSFDAVTSQFGIEYGDIVPISVEIARLLKDDGRILFLVHHRGSRIVEHNRRRLEALTWARETSGLWERARRLSQARLLNRLPTPPSFLAAIDDARRRFPDQPVAVEFPAALAQALSLGERDPRQGLARIDWLGEQSADEMERLQSLLGAARDEEGIATLRTTFESVGLPLPPAVEIAEEDGRPLAWRLDGRGERP